MTVKKINLKADIPEALLGRRLDVILSEVFKEYSRGTLQSWIKQGSVLIDGKAQTKNSVKINLLGQITIDAEIKEQTAWLPEPIELNIVYEDSDLIVINKPAGLVTHPATGNEDGTLVNALLHHNADLAELPRAGIIHRLDKDTTGLMVVPKTLVAHNFLVDQLQQRLINRHYQALVYGTIISGGTVEANIGRHPTNRVKMAIVQSGKTAVTHYRVNTKYKNFTLLDLKLETGRTHQIRVHMQSIDHPIVGDQVYGRRLHIPKGSSDPLAEILRHFHRQALHAIKLSLTHPTTKETMEWQAPLPQDFQNILAELNKEAL